MPKIVEVNMTKTGREALTRLPGPIQEHIEELLQSRRGEDLSVGVHIEWLTVEGRAFTLTMFVDEPETEGGGAVLWLTDAQAS